jgi:hypothetical protein
MVRIARVKEDLLLLLVPRIDRVPWDGHVSVHLRQRYRETVRNVGGRERERGRMTGAMHE